jgi:hypothetical protein
MKAKKVRSEHGDLGVFPGKRPYEGNWPSANQTKENIKHCHLVGLLSHMKVKKVRAKRTQASGGYPGKKGSYEDIPILSHTKVRAKRARGSGGFPQKRRLIRRQLATSEPSRGKHQALTFSWFLLAVVIIIQTALIIMLSLRTVMEQLHMVAPSAP